MRIIFSICILIGFGAAAVSQSINRKQLVERHTIFNTSVDSLSSLSVGNGSFAFTVDVTGLQSFPDAYAKGVPLGTQSEWGWHSFPNTQQYKFEDALKTYHLNGRDVKYAVQWNGSEQNKNASNYFRQNLHRLQLANIGLEIIKKDGTLFSIDDVKNIHQSLNLWTGEIHSQFTVEDVPVEVTTYCHQTLDAIAVKVLSPLIKEKRLFVRLRFPYPTGDWADFANNYKDENKHQSSFLKREEGISFIHQLDSTKYFVSVNCRDAGIKQKEKHYFLIAPPSSNSFEFTFQFSQKTKAPHSLVTYSSTRSNNEIQWRGFWRSGGAIDFSGSTNKQAPELERRIVLSQYLTKIQCAGNNPPQETGLTYNSWYGKPHMEMHWWHGVHFALWGRPALLEKSLAWYKRVAGTARQIAKRQGYQGVRWQKMTDNDGRESPSSIGAFLIWQQPHFIYFTELIYRQNPGRQTLNKYKALVFATADFMASYAFYDSTLKRYI
ncbi:MAG: hypothetical protein ABIS01_00515, partial [Ferruginibacter sp.]